MITYYADSTAPGGPLSSPERMKQANELFGNIVVPIHYALGTHSIHTDAYQRCLDEYAQRPNFLVGTHRLFTPHTPLGMILSPTQAIPDPCDLKIQAYLAFLERCQTKINRDMARVHISVIDHPAPDLLQKPLAYGETVTKDCLIQNTLTGLMCTFPGAVSAYGIPFWRSATGHPWWEPREWMGTSQTMYTASFPQPTLAQQKTRLATLNDAEGHKCVFFSLLHDPIEETAYMHRNDNNAEDVDLWVLWPQPGTSTDTTPWEKVEKYMELMK